MALPAAFTPKLVDVLREGYSMALLRADALAGLTVAVVALPLAMALAIASGASPDKGLITAIVAGFLVSALGGSRVQIGGPTGAFVVVVFNVIAQHGYAGLVLATLMSGLILVAAGYAGLGRVINFMPQPVVTGFTAGIALIIATSQVKDFFGLAVDPVPADFIAKWAAFASGWDTANPYAVAVGAGALALILGLKRAAPRLPGFLIAIVLASLLVSLLHLPVETIGSRFGRIAAGLPAPHLPAISLAKLQELFPSALTIAFLAGIEALLSAVVADGMTGRRHRSNQELVAQGVANAASALFAGLPATGAIARTATNIKAGARTPVAGMLHAAFLLAFLLVGADLMAFVPMAALAAILFVVAWGMSEIDRVAVLWRMPIGDRALLVLTFALTVLVDLTVAIGVGVTLAALLFMERMSRAVAIDAGEDADQRAALPPGVEVFRIAGPFFFGVADQLLETLRRMGRSPRAIVLRMEAVPLLDASGAAAIDAFVAQAGAMHCRVVIAGLQPEPGRTLARLGVDGGRVVFAADYAAALAQAAAIAALH